MPPRLPLALAICLGTVALTRVTSAQPMPALAVLPNDFGPYADRRFDERHRILVAAQIGALDRGTSGTLAGFGYDGDVAASAGVDVRVFGPMWGCSECLSHGLAIGYTYSAGSSFGLLEDPAYRLHIVDVAYAARVEFPCMRREHRHVYLTGLIGVVGMDADAGLGDVAFNSTDHANDRSLAAQRDDYLGLGWRLGASLDASFGAALVGIGLDLREVYGIGATEARTFMVGASLRVGFDIAWPHGPRPSPPPVRPVW